MWVIPAAPRHPVLKRTLTKSRSSNFPCCHHVLGSNEEFKNRFDNPPKELIKHLLVRFKKLYILGLLIEYNSVYKQKLASILSR